MNQPRDRALTTIRISFVVCVVILTGFALTRPHLTVWGGLSIVAALYGAISANLYIRGRNNRP